jgi:hypothetical protein
VHCIYHISTIPTKHEAASDRMCFAKLTRFSQALGIPTFQLRSTKSILPFSVLAVTLTTQSSFSAGCGTLGYPIRRWRAAPWRLSFHSAAVEEGVPADYDGVRCEPAGEGYCQRGDRRWR